LITEYENLILKRPYELIEMEHMGWCLVAVSDIKRKSLLCEYVGELKKKPS
jgi:hypothetical protein